MLRQRPTLRGVWLCESAVSTAARLTDPEETALLRLDAEGDRSGAMAAAFRNPTEQPFGEVRPRRADRQTI